MSPGGWGDGRRAREGGGVGEGIQGVLDDALVVAGVDIQGGADAVGSGRG